MAKVVAETDNEMLQGFVTEHVDCGVTVYATEATIYEGLTEDSCGRPAFRRGVRREPGFNSRHRIVLAQGRSRRARGRFII